jgi:hypothetical protein
VASLFDLLPTEQKIIGIVRESVALDVAIEDILTKVAESVTTVPTEKIQRIVDYFTTTVPQANQYLLSLPRTALPDPNQLAPNLTTQRRNFSYVVQVNGYIPGTSIPTKQFVTVSTNSLLSRQQAAQLGFSRTTVQSKYEEIIPVNADVVSATVSNQGIVGNPLPFPVSPEGFGHGIF